MKLVPTGFHKNQPVFKQFFNPCRSFSCVFRVPSEKNAVDGFTKKKHKQFENFCVVPVDDVAA
jgi:hypothetical protein